MWQRIDPMVQFYEVLLALICFLYFFGGGDCSIFSKKEITEWYGTSFSLVNVFILINA